MYLDKYLKERNTKYIFLNFILLPTVVFFNRGIFVFGFYFQSLFLLLTNGFGLQQGLARLTVALFPEWRQRRRSVTAQLLLSGMSLIAPSCQKLVFHFLFLRPVCAIYKKRSNSMNANTIYSWDLISL